MTKALMAVDFLAAREEARRPAMNPASIIWPEWPRDEDAEVRVFAQSTRPRAWRNDQPVIVLNKDWKGTDR
jgi:hypothetical protein